MKTILTTLLLAAATAQAQYLEITNRPTKVLLSWDASTSPNVTNYNLYIGTNGPNKYIAKSICGTNLSIIVTGLVAGVTWYAADTATDSLGVESSWAEPISFSFSPPPQPGVMRNPVFVVAQSKPFGGQWCDLATLAIEPNQSNQLYRVKIASTP